MISLIIKDIKSVTEFTLKIAALQWSCSQIECYTAKYRVLNPPIEPPLNSVDRYLITILIDCTALRFAVEIAINLSLYSIALLPIRVAFYRLIVSTRLALA